MHNFFWGPDNLICSDSCKCTAVVLLRFRAPEICIHDVGLTTYNKQVKFKLRTANIYLNWVCSRSNPHSPRSLSILQNSN